MTYPQQGGPQQQGGYGPGYPQPGLVLVLALTGDDDDKPGTAGGGAPPDAPGIPDPTLDYTAQVSENG